MSLKFSKIKDTTTYIRFFAFGQLLDQRRFPAEIAQEAVFALDDDPFFREALGAGFVDYWVHIKKTEIERFQTEVSDWEHREYFEMF